MKKVCFEIEQGRPLLDAFSHPKENLFSFAQILGNFKSQFMERLATA